MNKAKLIIFDVNETLLNLNPVKNAINTVFQDEEAFQIWFSTMLQYAMVESINPSETYQNFGQIAEASLNMVSKKLNKSLNKNDISAILSKMAQLPTHSDVHKGLRTLKDKGYKLVVLTNGTQEVLIKQMAFSDLSQYFETFYSVESVKSFKPQKITYDFVLKQQSVKPEEAMMVAAHSWDIHGANAAGLQTAFIARPDQMYYPLMREPTFVCNDLLELANRM